MEPVMLTPTLAAQKNRGVFIQLGLLLGFGLLIAYLFLTNLVLAIGIAVLPAAALAALLLFGKPIRALYLFIILLPVHSLIITLLLSKAGLSISLLRLVAGWKELLLLGALLVVLLNFSIRMRMPRLTWVDGVALLWFLQVFIYFGLHDLLFSWDASMTTILYGARDWFLYLIPFFLGRFIYVKYKELKLIFKLILLVSLFTSIFAFIDYFILPTAWHIQMGVPRYFREFLGISYPDYLGGLPENYWTNLGPYLVRRPVSTFLSGQGFALPFLVIIPFSLFNYFSGVVKQRRTILGLNGAALLLSLTRMTIVACAVQVILLLLLMKKKRTLIKTIVLSLLAVTLIIAAVPAVRVFVVNTITLSDPSSSARPSQWVYGMKLLYENPFGMGLGSTGQTGYRFGGPTNLGEEAGFFKLTGALGFPGLFLFTAWFAGIFYYGSRLARRRAGLNSGIGLVTITIATGFLINNLTAPPDQSPFVIYLFCWLAGLTVQLAQRVPRTSEKRLPASHTSKNDDKKRDFSFD
jgi:O-antigen ligase